MVRKLRLTSRYDSSQEMEFAEFASPGESRAAYLKTAESVWFSRNSTIVRAAVYTRAIH